MRNRISSLLLIPLALFLSIGAAPVSAAQGRNFTGAIPGPDLASRSAVLLDATTGAVLFEKGADEVIPPASLTKLMTMHLVLEAVASGSVSLDDRVDLPRETWAASQLWGSSLMFLAPGQIVTLREILLGLAVASGNDAAAAAAIHVAGSVDSFVQRMNAEAARLGLERTRFVDPSGYSERNLTTARDFSSFCRVYLAEHPESLIEFHSVREFAYPQPRNLPEAFRDKPGTVKQTNRNILLGTIEGVDGLKTGYIIESGYNIALTARRGETRLLAVLLGGPGSSSAQGGRVRAEDGEALLGWGFSNFRTIRPVVERLEAIRVWMGSRNQLALVPATVLAFTAETGRAAKVAWEIRRKSPVLAPVAKGDILGELVFSDQLGELHRVDLAAAETVPRGNILKRAIDGIALFFLKLFGAAV